MQCFRFHMPESFAIREIAVGDDSIVVGTSAVMLALYAAAAKLADLESPLLIIGEAGAGKRTIAHHIHNGSPRRSEPFRIIDSLAFSTAVDKGNGADKMLGSGGTVLFTQPSQMSQPAQQKILKLIQRDRRGPRIVAASNEDLDHAVRTRRIGEEFCHAISAVSLRVPPLRARRDEISLLTNYFLQQYARAFGRPKPKPSSAAVEFFQTYRWPGNVAELETAMKSLVAIGDETLVMAALRASAWANGRSEGRPTASLKQAAREASLEAERELISDVLLSTAWNRKRAAQQLQISYKALLYKLKRIGIESPALRRTMENGESQ